MANEELRLKKGAHGRKDPIMGALREQSTHYAAGTRITVYERLGLNKPGFWADHQQRKLEQQETDENYDVTPKWQPPMLEYESQWPEYGNQKQSKGITFHKTKLEDSKAGPSTSPGDPRATKQFKTQLNAVVANNWKSIGKAHPWLTTSASDMLAAEKYSTSYALAQAFGEALRKDPHAMLNKVATDYYFDKSNAAAIARNNVPFGHGEPTQFEKMQAMLQKVKPVIKGNTKGVSVLTTAKTSAKQGITMATPRVIQGPGKPQLNVHANGYASNYPYSNFS